MSDCLSQDLIDRFVAHELSPDELQEVQAHLKTCAACRQRVESNRPTVTTPGPGEPTLMDRAAAVGPEARANLSDEDVTTAPLEALQENYQILGELPRGGQAVIYKAIHKPTKMKVALKVLSSERLDSARARRAFEREVDLVAQLHHPNIVQLHDSGVTRGQYYFSMEYIRGKPLDVYVANRALGAREIVDLFVKICGAVGHAHDRGIIHSDLKPSNILVDDNGEPHVLDFGLARASGSSLSLVPVTGEWAGTLCYMSPEQVEGLPDLMTFRSDVYSLGVILYQLLTDRFPYDVSGGTAGVMRAIQCQDPIRPRQFLRRFDPDLETILLKCLAKDRSRRYSSAVELQKELQRWQQGQAIEAKSDSLGYVLGKHMSRHKVAAAVVPLLAVIVVSFACVSFQLYRHAAQAERRALLMAEQWRDQSNEQLTHFTEALFLDFLEFLRSDHLRSARNMAPYFGNASKEGRAVRFLLDPNAAAVREQDFRAAVAPKAGDPNSWFADLIIGERHLKLGRRQEAALAYQRSDQALSGQRQLSGLQRLARLRLRELTRAPADAGVSPPAEPQTMDSKPRPP